LSHKLSPSCFEIGSCFMFRPAWIMSLLFVLPCIAETTRIPLTVPIHWLRRES
jgi:hypothetical protein